MRRRTFATVRIPAGLQACILYLRIPTPVCRGAAPPGRIFQNALPTRQGFSASPALGQRLPRPPATKKYLLIITKATRCGYLFQMYAFSKLFQLFFQERICIKRGIMDKKFVRGVAAFLCESCIMKCLGGEVVKC